MSPFLFYWGLIQSKCSILRDIILVVTLEQKFSTRDSSAQGGVGDEGLDHVESILFVTGGRLLLASSGWRPEMLLNSL